MISHEPVAADAPADSDGGVDLPPIKAAYPRAARAASTLRGYPSSARSEG